jgi:hypothetical protein
MSNQDLNKLIFLPLDMPSPPDILDILIEEDKDLYHCGYKQSDIIVMYDKGTHYPIMDKIPEFKEWVNKELLPWTGDGSVCVIITRPGDTMATHIDCEPAKFHTLQHKFRYVYKGNTTDLRWKRKNDWVHANPVNEPYMISGRWPHGLVNTTNETRYTLCLGAPWESDLADDKYRKMLEKSYAKNKDRGIFFDDWELPDNWRDLFDLSRYKVTDDVKPIL